MIVYNFKLCEGSFEALLPYLGSLASSIRSRRLWMDGCWAALWGRCVMKCAPVIGLLVRERRARAARACAQLARITAATAGTELSRVTSSHVTCHAESAVNTAAVMTRGSCAHMI